MGYKHHCNHCNTNTDCDVCPECFAVLKGKHKGKDYHDLTATEQKGLTVM